MILRKQGWILYWGGWLLIGLYFAGLDATVLSEGPANLPRLVVMDVLLHLILGALVLVVIRSLKRYPLGDISTWPRWIYHLVMCLIFSVVGLAAAFSINLVLRGAPLPPWEVLGRHFAHFFWRYFHLSFMDFLIAMGAFTAVDMYRRFKARELHTSQLEARLAQAQNQVLRMQLQPHFLFNKLHSVSALIEREPAAADLMLSRLGDLLRRTLDLGGKQEITLRQELAILHDYLEIQRIRFQDRLRVQEDCPESLMDALVPSFMLQPQVENALKHGLVRRAHGGRIILRARAEGQTLILEVEDDGEGLAQASPRQGIGTANTLARLELLYGSEQSFELLPVPSGGTLARISLPIHHAPCGESESKAAQPSQKGAPQHYPTGEMTPIRD